MLAALATVLATHAHPLHLRKGTWVYRVGDEVSAYLIVRSGTIRVQITAHNGREIVLYRVTADESCILTTSSLLSREPCAAEASCETDVEAFALPRSIFQKLLAEDAAFRDFVLSAYATRVADLILLMEETSFQAVPRRLARLLLARAEAGIVASTHQALAIELGTAREVVSRHLKEFERRGVIHGHRGVIEIADAASLSRIGEEND